MAAAYNPQPKEPKAPKFIQQGMAKLEKKGYAMGTPNASAASGAAGATATPGMTKPITGDKMGMATTPTETAPSGGGFAAILGQLNKAKTTQAATPAAAATPTTTATPAAQTGGLEPAATPAATTQIAGTTAAADAPPSTTPAPSPAPTSGGGFAAALSQIPEAKSTAELLGEYTSQESPLMRLSATQGLQAANRRGMLNSSMAVGAAQDSMVKNAVPIASQDAQLQADARQKALDRATTLTTKDWDLKESARTAASQMLVNMEQIYANQFNSIMANDKLSKGTREAMIQSAQKLRAQQRNFVEQVYDIDLLY